MDHSIKSMQLYPRADRLLKDLEALGYLPDQPVPVDVLNQFDQLHYHGTAAVDDAIASCGIAADAQVLEVGSGWGGCARHIAHSMDCTVTAIELQQDYDTVARALTGRAQMRGRVIHVNADFLEASLPEAGFDHAVSWLALFHIPDRPRYLRKIHASLKPNGCFAAEDLYLIQAPNPDEQDDFNNSLFPNSLVEKQVYLNGLKDAGFINVDLEDMTADWTTFTIERLQAFRENRQNYEAIHGADGFQAIETFYAKMASYFERGLVGGIRFSARKA